MASSRSVVAAHARGVLVAILAGGMLIAAAVAVYGGTTVPKHYVSLAQQKLIIKAQAELKRGVFQKLLEFGAEKIGNTGNEEGNKGVVWNVGSDYGGENANALARGWKSGSDTQHDGGVGMFGSWGVDWSYYGGRTVQTRASAEGLPPYNILHMPPSCCSKLLAGNKYESFVPVCESMVGGFAYLLPDESGDTTFDDDSTATCPPAPCA